MAAVKRVRRNSSNGDDPAKYVRKHQKEDYLRFLLCLREAHGNIKRALRAAGITGGYNAVVAWTKNNPWFAQRFSEVMDSVYEEAADAAQDKVFSSLKNSRKVAMWFLLHHRKGFERGFAKRTFAQVESKAKVALDVRVQADLLLKKLTVDELEILEKILRKLSLPSAAVEGGLIAGSDGGEQTAETKACSDEGELYSPSSGRLLQ